ncbi:MAG: hypothetical protein ACRCZS_28065, partial [Chroococcidiopsis sp.]
MITSERELQEQLVIHLTEQGYNCQQYVPCSVGIADLVIDNAVIELKHLPDREALFKAVGQAVLYRGAIDKNLDAKIICSYSSEASLLALEAASVVVKQFGLELIPWVKYDSLVFQTDYKYKLLNTFTIGDICLISSLCQAKLLTCNRCWGIITRVFEFGCSVRLWHGEIFVNTQHLKKLDLNINHAQEIYLISDRLSKFAGRGDLDEIDLVLLDFLQVHTVWTDRQLLLLKRMEED